MEVPDISSPFDESLSYESMLLQRSLDVVTSTAVQKNFFLISTLLGLGIRVCPAGSAQCGPAFQTRCMSILLATAVFQSLEYAQT